MDVQTATHPKWENVKDGKLKATIRMSKPKSKIFNKPHVHEEVIGNEEDRPVMEEHLQAVLAWLKRYDEYYNVEGWRYELIWKEPK